MTRVRLARLDPALERAFAHDVDYREALGKEDWPALAAAMQRLAGDALRATPAESGQLPWGGYFAVDDATGDLIGSCAFKKPPTAEGAVEIAYFTYPGFEGRGYATEMARELVRLASGSGDVRRVIAHTLPESNASTQVLQKVGMTFVGEVMDPEDGRVWQWQMQVGG